MNQLQELLSNDSFVVIAQLILLVVIALLSYWVSKRLGKIIDFLIKKSDLLIGKIFWSDSIKNKINYIIPPIIIFLAAREMEGIPLILMAGIKHVSTISIIIIGIVIINRILFNITDIEHIKRLPNYLGIKVVLEAVKLILYLVAGVVIFAYLTQQSPLSLLSALGALTAVLLLVFRDSILGLSSGIQISANKMVEIGDWIELPNYGADGMVIEIRLTTVKVKNWDNSIVNLPAYALVQNSFKNWQGMIASGGRRIKRSIYINISSIRFLNTSEVKKIGTKDFFKQYLEQRKFKGEVTTIELFRAYINFFLRNHPCIKTNMTLMVRQLKSSSKGIPLEIYAFTNTTDWVEYETIQTEIFEHLFAKAREFSLVVFQDPNSHDFKNLVTTDHSKL